MAASTVDSVIEKALSSESVKGKSAAEIRALLNRNFNTNQVRATSVREIRIERNKKTGLLEVDASYEDRIPLMFNIDVILKFDDLKYTVGQKAVE